jgi:hypothetical protein
VSRTYRRAVQEAVKQPVTGQFRASTQKYDLGSRTKTETERALCELKQSAHVSQRKQVRCADRVVCKIDEAYCSMHINW